MPSKEKVMNKNYITLTEDDKQYLLSLQTKGVVQSRKILRVRALLLLDQGMSYAQVCKDLDVSYPAVLKWAKNFNSEGLAFLDEKPRSGRPKEFSVEFMTKVTALACSNAPEGHSQWSLRLLADRVVELDFVDKVSHSTIGRVLKKTNFSPIENNNGASGK